MSDNTSIAWCHKTFNGWIGCEKIAAACKFCYAETYANRYGLAKWGVSGTRHITSAANWKKPLAWNKQAEKEGVRYRVFAQSLADTFEDREDLHEPRMRLFELIDKTPHLDWMLLTKRPQNCKTMFPVQWLVKGQFPKNIWLGATIANQKDHGELMPALSDFCDEHKVKVMWLSCEPLLGNIHFNVTYKSPDLIILGGESGHVTKIRPLDLYHVKNIIQQFHRCPNTHIFFKQLGSILAKQYKLADSKGENFAEYPELLNWLKRREMPFYKNEFKLHTI